MSRSTTVPAPTTSTATAGTPAGTTTSTGSLPAPARRPWTAPRWQEFRTPLEVTGYAATR
ncbi:MAG TPA: hypothetical protein VIL00_13580 [Pseudonocardiaceae bacterium]